ncbi:hypothetical protein J7438_09000 [Thalassotalea sp. G20_0]|uniref:hypothetical protein n=1 Tax=Thalassotalea sp. G20_0 TaxID=2821093 RepID=UPI001ADB765E|nr:hypothetical protein [Thalassotalea sp. G20_0]MBO9494224.1 hypothetical protein [Thalassotalea sp. G20_0]
MLNTTGSATLSGYVTPSTQEKKATEQQGDDKAVGPKSQTSSDLPLSHRAVSITEKSTELKSSEKLKLMTTSSPKKTAIDQVHSPFKADDITVDDPEFKRPPGKIKKLALAIKIFSKSFKTIYQVNNPETDRSSLVEAIRSKAYTVSSVLLHTLNLVLASAVTPALFVGALILCASFPKAVAAVALAVPIGLLITVGVFAIGYMLTHSISNFITSAVSASVDTREKLAEITAFTSPEERFLSKYQRMEESLRELRTQLYAAESAKINDYIKFYKENGETENLRLKNEELARLEKARDAAGIPAPDKEDLYDSVQRYCLEDYGCDIERLKDAIHKTEDWLNRAAKQKALLTKEQQELEELYDDVAPPIVGKLELEPLDLILV